jgi:hypothetical protein
MRGRFQVAVKCQCGWTGQRAITMVDRKCSKCGALPDVVQVVDERKEPAGCRSCGWWGPRLATRVRSDCPVAYCRDRGGRTEPLQLLTCDGSSWAIISDLIPAPVVGS